MQVTIKKLLGLTLLVALLVNGLINHFAATTPQFVSEGLRRRKQVNFEQRILILKRALETSQHRRTKLEELGVIDPETADEDPQ